MKTFSELVESIESDIIGILKTYGAGELEITSQYISTTLRKKQQVFDIVNALPEEVDYDVFVYEQNNIDGAKELENKDGINNDAEPFDESDDEYTLDEIGYEDLTDQFHEYQLVIYLYNTDIYSEEYDIFNEDVQLDEIKRIIKVNARGQRRIKMKCKQGYKFDGHKCVKITGSELVTKRRAIKKAIRTKKSKGSGFQRKVYRLRMRALKKRKSMGL